MKLAPGALKTIFAGGACAALLCFFPNLVRSEDVRSKPSPAAAMLPSSVIALAEIPRLGDSIESIMQHPLRERLLGMPIYAAMIQTEPYKRFQMGLSAFEGSMKQSWQEALQTLTDGGLTVAFSPDSDGSLAVLINSSNPEALERLQDFVLGLQLLSGNSD